MAMDSNRILQAFILWYVYLTPVWCTRSGIFSAAVYHRYPMDRKPLRTIGLVAYEVPYFLVRICTNQPKHA